MRPCPGAALPAPALPGGALLGAHFTLITTLCGGTMESAGLRLHNRLNPAEIQVLLKGTGRRYRSRQACLVKQIRTGAAQCGPLPCPCPEPLHLCRRTAKCTTENGETNCPGDGDPPFPRSRSRPAKVASREQKELL